MILQACEFFVGAYTDTLIAKVLFVLVYGCIVATFLFLLLFLGTF
jgi:hypothetical protein